MHDLRLRFEAFNARSSQYRPDIDGLRAVAVLGVVLYHLDVARFSGGFVGVDVFFVISGYLITSILVRDMEAGSFSFARFYERRIRRIFPALIGVAVTSLVVFSILLTPQDLVLFGQNLMAMCGFVSNLFLADLNQHLGYFDWTAKEQALLHTWSLAVEEQFYFFFPMALLLIEKFAKRFRSVLIVLLGVASFVYGVRAIAAYPTTAYFSFPARGWELLMGALLAGEGLVRLRWRVVRELVGAAGLALIGYAMLVFDRHTTFPGKHALIPCVGAALVLYAGRDGGSVVKRVLSFGPLVFVGLISYSLYLWHWPVLAAFRYFSSRQYLTQTDAMVLFAVSVVLAFLSFEFVETPFRGSASLLGRRRVFAYGVGANVALACAGMLLVHGNGLPQRYSPGVRAAVAANEARENDWFETGRCANFQHTVRNYADVSFCQIGHAKKNIMLFGDSMVEQLYPLAAGYSQDDLLKGKGVIMAIGAGCPPMVHLNRVDSGYYCNQIAAFAIERAQQDDIDTVVIQYSPWWTEQDGLVCVTDERGCVRVLTRGEAVLESIAELKVEVETLKRANKRVILGLPFPYYTWPIPRLMMHNVVFSQFHQVRLADQRGYPEYRVLEEEIARAAGVEKFDPQAILCPGGGVCRYEVGGVSLYRDGSHLAASRVGILHDGLLAVLNGTR